MERKYRLYKEERGLGMSGIIQIGPLEVYEGDRLIGKFDQYEVVDFSDDNLCWSPDGSRVGFYAYKYPAETFPIFDYELDKLGFQGVVCALDIKKMEIIEMPLEHIPQELKWDDDGTILNIVPQPEK